MIYFNLAPTGNQKPKTPKPRNLNSKPSTPRVLRVPGFGFGLMQPQAVSFT